MKSMDKEIIQTLQQQMQQIAVPKKKAWWERYMRGTISFRGVGIPEIRKLQVDWYKKYLQHLSHEEQVDIAMELFRQELAEDKLAGVLLFQNYLLDAKPCAYMIKQYETLFDEKLIVDWNVCDWFCVRVLSPTIKEHKKEGAKQISSWRDASYLWQARASVVAFIGHTDTPMYYEDIFENCSVLIQREERFAKTAVGWILHDIYKKDEKIVYNFVDKYLKYFDTESLKNALKYSEKDGRDGYLLRMKEMKK